MSVKPHELAQKSRADLLEDLKSLEKKLFELRGQMARSGARKKLTDIRNLRRDVARVKTVLMNQQRDAIKSKYAEAKKKNEGPILEPKDIRPHVTKAERQKLPAKYAQKLTKRAAKRAKYVKPIKYALKA